MPVTGVIFDLKRFAVHDGPGIRTTVFFKGCLLRCWWCHNPESQNLRPEHMEGARRRYCSSWNGAATADRVGTEVTVEQVMQEVEKDVVFFDESGGGVTFSGGEPLLQLPFLQALLEACRDKSIHTVVDTSGYAPWPDVEQIVELVDLFLYDLKVMDDEAHQKYANVGNVLIKENLVRLHDRGAPIILRIPLIPGITDTDTNLSQLAHFIAPLHNIREVHVLPYNPIGEEKYRRLRRANRLGPLRTQTAEELAFVKDVLLSLKTNVNVEG